MEALQARPGKKQVKDNVPKRIKELQFGILSNQDIVNQAVLEVSDRNSYDSVSSGPNREITKHGPMDGRMGVSGKHVTCETCGQELHACNGHFGHVKLALPAFHIGYLKRTVEVLQSICKSCSRILINENRQRDFRRNLRKPSHDYNQRERVCKSIREDCRKVKECPHCGAVNGIVKKVPTQPLKVIHDRFSAFTRSTAKSKMPPPAKIEFDKSFDEAKKTNPDLEKHLKKAFEDMNPLKVLNLFKRIPATDCELLGMDPARGRPEMFLWQYVPAPPVSIRPSVAQDAGTTEDDITGKLGDIIDISQTIRAGLSKGQPVQTIMAQWDHLQLQLALYVNSDVPGVQQQVPGKSIRGFCQRLKGKQGRFRGNLSGKRVDFSGRTVITPDPNLGIDEVAVPERVAVKMTYPEVVSRYNIEKLRQRIRNGNKHPGANFIIKKTDKRKIFVGVLVMMNKLDAEANNLEIGDVVERHLEDGDIVLFNRQPSLHKLSILSHRAKIRPYRTFRLNECVCNPYNADFDGDEMNLHVPQTEEARAEAIELMGVKNNLCTPKNGTPIIAAIQDFITAAYLLSSKNNFYDRKSFTQFCGYMFNNESVFDPETGERMPIEIPEPAVLKPQRLWTGKQVWNVLLRPNKRYKAQINLDAPCRQYKALPNVPPDMNEDDAWLVIRNSEVMCGVMDKATVGDGKKDSIFYVTMRDFGPDYAVQAMNRLSKLSAKWLTNQGFSIGISDVYPGEDLVNRKKKLIDDAYAKCDGLIEDFTHKRLRRDPGCDEEQTLENKSTGILNAVRQEAGAICLEQLSRWNSPSIMARCGSKGSNINVAQMVAAVGQQSIGNKRVSDGFQDRTLPHFPKASRQPGAKGFVQNSFFSGLSPTEFLFHAMSGREGLVDTAVKTAETGYMSRRLMKSLEDLSARYDNTVRNSSSGIVQFQYGDDKLDPADMEAKAKPVQFERTFTHAITITWDNDEDSLLPFEVMNFTKKRLESERAKLGRFTLVGEHLDYRDKSDHGVDQLESARDFLDTLESFIRGKASRLARVRKQVRMLPAEEDVDEIDWSMADDVEQKKAVYGIVKISEKALDTFINLCLSKYEKSVVQPGHAVGAVGAQSIGEPGTQMTLKTFHFAGVAGMSITQGVPRIKEIINASRHISTPVISCELSNKESEHAARIVKSRIEKTYLRDITSHMDDNWQPEGSYISLRVDKATIEKLQLDLSMRDIERAIAKMKSFKSEGHSIKVLSNTIRVYIAEVKDEKRRTTSQKEEDLFVRTQAMLRALPNVVVKGYPEATRAIIKKEETPNANGIEEVSLLVEGYGLKACMTTEGINGHATRTNSVIETLEVLGIEAARKTIIDEIGSVMGSMDIDPRHMALLADVMTYKGEILGITRFGLAKMRDSVLQLASFEKTPDHLFEAGFRMKKDCIEGVSECIIMGQSISLGTGAFQVVRRLALSEEDVGKKETSFEDCWAELQKKKHAKF